MSKHTVQGGTISAKTYPLMENAVETGLLMGWNRAHKHTDTPDPGSIREYQYEAIMQEICEAFDFGDVS